MRVKFFMLLSLLSISLSNQSIIAAKSNRDETEKAFSYIYDHAVWGRNTEGEGFSGGGSTLQYAAPYMRFLENFLRTNGIQSVVDVGCGDWTFSRHLRWGSIRYLGVDVVKSVIEKNQKQFSTPNITFMQGNCTSLDLPSADLLLCKDVLQHLPNGSIIEFLKQISKFQHCLITNDINPNSEIVMNQEIAPGDYRPIDLTLAPFHIEGAKVLTYNAGGVVKQVLYIKKNK